MSSSLFDLTGKSALITGSSQGIGYALARGLAAAGASIILNGRDQSKLRSAADRLTAEGVNVATLEFDATDLFCILPYEASVRESLKRASLWFLL